MSNQNNELKPPAHRARPGSPPQNWGQIIGIGIVMLGMLVMVVNLSVYKAKLNLAAAVPPEVIPFWVQIGRLAGLVISLSVGFWLLQRLLRRGQPAEEPYLSIYLQQAVSYIQKIENLLKAGKNSHERQLLTQIRIWWQMIETMAQALADLGQNEAIIHDDLDHLPEVIVDLEGQLEVETNPLLQADLKQMLRQRQNQHLALEQLQTTRRRAEIQIERTISVLGTIYSQLLTYRSTFHVVDYQQLADNVHEEVQCLQDYLEALQEVKGGHPPND